MRLLKFRAWDTVKKKWIVEGFHIIGETTVFDMLKQYRLENFNDIEVTQYTGLISKDGKEIYEGDIIKNPDPCYWKSQGGDIEPTEDDKFLWRGGTAQVIAVPFGFKMQEIDCGRYSFNDPEGEHWLAKEIEIIGNIYENPELIKEVNR